MTRPQSRRRCRCAFSYVEVLVVLVLIVLAVAFFFPSLDRLGDTDYRGKCASNLRQIGQALLLYSNDNRGHYPRTIYTPAPIVVPVSGTGATAANPFASDGPAPNDVTAALFLLLRTQDITSEVFTCPSAAQEKDIFDGKPVANRSNFTSIANNLSYSLQNPYPNAGAIPEDKGWWTNQMGAEQPVAADMNPGQMKGKNVLKPTSSSSANDMRLANSLNHDGDGQNILYADGHVEWESNPFVGVNKDNIYTTKDGKINASPVNADDAILLPTTP